jgi:hypothetical protein
MSFIRVSDPEQAAAIAAGEDPKKIPDTPGLPDPIDLDNMDRLETEYFFISSAYHIKKPEFLEVARRVADEFLEKVKKEHPQLDEIYPVYQTENLDDPRLNKFYGYIGDTAWNILAGQGYDMEHFSTFFQGIWCQEHYKHSSMEEHTHGFGSQIIGFYFLETPDRSCNIMLHDPRPAKTQIGLPERKNSEVNLASNAVFFKPEEGTFFFTNSWLAHSFTRSAAVKPMKFIHFVIGVLPNQSGPPPKNQNYTDNFSTQQPPAPADEVI